MTLARAGTPHGEVALRRRGDVLELVVDGAFAMDTVDTSTEVVLAAEGLRRCPAPTRVLVGGLGLGFTARAVLDDDRVEPRRRRRARRAARALVTRGLAPEITGIEGPRCSLHPADVADVLSGRAGPPGPWDVVLLDVDNGPGFLVHPSNASLYAAPGLATARAALAPGGVLVVWSSHVAPSLGTALRDAARAGDGVEGDRASRGAGRARLRVRPVLARARARRAWACEDGPVNPALVLRRELPGDEEPTRALHDAAFGVPEGAEHSAETVLLDGLRADGDVLDTLTLVAELDGEVLGHVVCSRATMGAGTSVALGTDRGATGPPGPGHRFGARLRGARHGGPAR